MDFTALPNLGYGTAAAVVAIIVATYLFRRWKAADKLDEEIRDVRKKYDLSVLAIRRGTDMLVSPRADFRFASGDVLLVLGEKEKVRALERL